MSNDLLSIGDVARLSGKAPSAIRYYEQVGLLPEPVRESGRRRYPSEVVRMLAVIETAQRGGLTLAEIRLLLATSDEDAGTIERLREIAQRKLPPLRQAIAQAEIVRGWLEAATRCQCPTLDNCALFDEHVSLPESGRARRDSVALLG